MKNIPFHKADISEEDVTAVSEVIRSGWLTMGQKTFDFEKSFVKDMSDTKAIGLNSGTAALHLALICAGVEAGDEVIVPAITFASTANVIRMCGAKPVIVDVERNTHLIDINALEKTLSKKTKAVIPVHFAGQTCDMNILNAIAEDNDIKIIEDAAHAYPTFYRDKMAGSLGFAAAFSFYVTKTITSGEGGMLTTNDSAVAERARLLRLHGISKDAWKRYSKEGSWRYDVTEWGYKYNMTDMAAALGFSQLKRAQEMTQRRKDISAKYDEAFKNLEEIHPYEINNFCQSSYHLYPLRLNLEKTSTTRDNFIKEMNERGIGTSVHFIPLYHFSCNSDLKYSPSNFPNSEWIFERSVSLPIYPGLTDEDVDYIIENVIDIVTQ